MKAAWRARSGIEARVGMMSASFALAIIKSSLIAACEMIRSTNRLGTRFFSIALEISMVVVRTSARTLTDCGDPARADASPTATPGPRATSEHVPLGVLTEHCASPSAMNSTVWRSSPCLARYSPGRKTATDASNANENISFGGSPLSAG
eukprot:2594831-Prymnesium_polylepis.1